MPQGMILIERSWNHLLDRAKIMRFCNRMRCPILAGCGSRSMRSRPAQLLSIRVVSHLGAQGLPCLQQPRPKIVLPVTHRHGESVSLSLQWGAAQAIETT